MRRDPKRLEHPKSVYIIWLMVLMILLFVLGGVVNHFVFSHHGPGLLVPLVEKLQKKASPDEMALERARNTEQHNHFHNITDGSAGLESFQTTCNICHSMLPHSKTKKVRALLNMHSNYLACETCHLELKEGEPIEYKWYSPLEKNSRGPFFGTSYDPETGELQRVDDEISKIIPLFENVGTPTPALHMQQGDEAREFMGIRDRYTSEQQKEMTKKFHENIHPTGPECQSCHSTKGILNLETLGFSKRRISDLQNLSIKGLFTDYDEFYLPELFSHYGFSEPSVQDEE